MIYSRWRIHWKNEEREGMILATFYRKGKIAQGDIEFYRHKLKDHLKLKSLPAILRLEKL